jgi:iron complex transport system substrate-binding protein
MCVRHCVVLFLFVMASAATAVRPATCTVIDDAGNTIELAQPAHRIISLAPDITETLFAIGASHGVVGVVSGSDYPADAKRLLRVGSYRGIDVEKILTLKPDLIITWGSNFTPALSLFKRRHIPVYISNPRLLEDVPRTIRRLGCLTATQPKAEAVADEFTAMVTALRRRFQTQQPVSVFFQVGNHPLMTINGHSWISQVIELCGGRNLFRDAKLPAPVISLESVVMANPAVIVSDSQSEQWAQQWRQFPQLAAVRSDKLIQIHPDLIDRAGPRLASGAAQICTKMWSGSGSR